jgi:thymidylate synthase (FAD)
MPGLTTNKNAEETMKVELARWKTRPEELVGRAAAKCYRGKDPAKSLGVAMKGGHHSVLEHAAFTFEIEGVSRALLAQLTRHRLASFSVESQRYVTYKKGFGYVIPPKIQELGEDAVHEYKKQMSTMAVWYHGWIEKLGPDGAEDARMVLPNACHTRLMMTMNARELRHFFSLRCCTRAQWEIRALADAMLAQVNEVMPNVFGFEGAFCDQHGYCPEGHKSCGKAPTMDELLKAWRGDNR